MLKKLLIVNLFLFSFCPSVYADNSPADFLSLCKTTLQNNPSSASMCDTLQQNFFSGSKTIDIANVTPAQVGAPSTPLDSQIHFIIFNDPNYLAGVAYCYFVYKNWISSESVTPDSLGGSATGFSILNESLPDYKKWLATSVEGKKCKTRVEKESEVSVADLDVSMKGKIALIGLNPYASIQTPNITLDGVLRDLALTINHERIHAYQVACPEFEKWSIAEWEKLPFAKKNEYIKKYTSYTWSIPKIAGREYIAYLYENTPSKIDEHVKSCKLK